MIDPKADTKQILAKFNKPQLKKKKKETVSQDLLLYTPLATLF